jgi:uncharacterized protein YaaW (UPF0174 family)
MAENIRVEVELSADQVEKLLTGSKTDVGAVRELTDEELSQITEEIRGRVELEEMEVAIISRLAAKAVSKVSSKQVQRVVADTVVGTVVDKVVAGSTDAAAQEPRQ